MIKHREDLEWEGFQKESQLQVQQVLLPFVLEDPQTASSVPPQAPSEFCATVFNPNSPAIQFAGTNSKSKQHHKTYPQIPITIVRNGIVATGEGQIVYKGFQPRHSDKYFTQAGRPKDQKASTQDNLVFDSWFQCGNLSRVVKKDDANFDLYMRVDTNTQGHLQWYYFKVTNTKAQKVVFSIYKFKKRLSLYQRGMKPYVKSRKQGMGWTQSGLNVSYVSHELQNEHKYFTLDFEYQFKHQNDQVLFAACPPYSYTFLLTRLSMINESPNCELGTIGQTLSGLDLPLVTFGHADNPNFVVVSARTHPGETSGSWVLDGLMSYLSGPQATEMLKKVTFKIVPMLNPDGVWMGNYRTGVIGKDFNRCFQDGFSSLIPEISQLKQLVLNLQKRGKILMYLDLHGHSIKRNSFVFGPDNCQFPAPFQTFIQELSSRSNLFKKSSCKLKTQLDSRDTARGYFQNVHKLFAITIQNSLGLYQVQGQCYPLLPERWRLFGRQFGQAISNAVSPRMNGQRLRRGIITKTIGQQTLIESKGDTGNPTKRVHTQKTERLPQKQSVKRRLQDVRWRRLRKGKNLISQHQQGSKDEVGRKVQRDIQLTDYLAEETPSQQTVDKTKRPQQLLNCHQKQETIGLKQGPNRRLSTVQLCSVYSLGRGELNLQKQLRQIENNFHESLKGQSDIIGGNLRHSVARTNLEQEQGNLETIQPQHECCSQSGSSDLNDCQNKSEDLQPEEMQELLWSVNKINKNRTFQFTIGVEEKRSNKFREVNSKHRISKQSSSCEIPKNKEALNRFKQITLNLGNGLKSMRKKKDTSPESQRHRRKFSQSIPSQEPNSLSVSFPDKQLPTLGVVINSKVKGYRKPVPFSRPSGYSTLKVSTLEGSIRQQILIETTKKLQKLQDQSIFSFRPFQEEHFKNRSKSKYFEPKHKF